MPEQFSDLSMLNVALHVRVVPPGGEGDGPAAVRASAVLWLTPPGQPPAEVRWDARRPWPGALDSLYFGALAGPGGSLGSWQAAYLDPGAVDRRRARAMSSVLARLDAGTGGTTGGATVAGFAAYLARAARVLGIGGALPFCVHEPGRAAPWTAWWRGGAAARVAWVEAELAAYRERAAGGSGAGRAAGLVPEAGRAAAVARHGGPPGGALARLLPGWPGGVYPEMLEVLVLAAGELWDSTGGDDPYDVLSARQRGALDLAAAVYRARLDRDMDAGPDLPGCLAVRGRVVVCIAGCCC